MFILREVWAWVNHSNKIRVIILLLFIIIITYIFSMGNIMVVKQGPFLNNSMVLLYRNPFHRKRILCIVMYVSYCVSWKPIDWKNCVWDVEHNVIVFTGKFEVPLMDNGPMITQIYIQTYYHYGQYTFSSAVLSKCVPNVPRYVFLTWHCCWGFCLKSSSEICIPLRYNLLLHLYSLV